jgi:hypothetical protein
MKTYQKVVDYLKRNKEFHQKNYCIQCNMNHLYFKLKFETTVIARMPYQISHHTDFKV